MSKIDRIRARALKTAEEHQKSFAGYANLIAAILEDPEVQAFVKTQTNQISEVQNLIYNVIKQSADKRDNGAPGLADTVDAVLEESLGHIKRHQDKLNGKEVLIILAVLLGKEPQPNPVKILSNNHITHSSVLKYLESYGIKLGSEPLLLEHDGSSYEPVLDEDDNSYLAKFTVCLNDVAHKGKLSPVVGRTEELEQVIRILRQKRKNNPMLLGEAGVGKTAIAEGLAQMAYEGALPPDLADKKIFQLDVNALIAGTIYRGMFEERIKGILDELADMDDSILFIDEIHMVMKPGSNTDISNIIKPALARGELTCIGATTFDEYRKFIAKDEAFTRRFEAVKVDEPSLEETHTILMGIKAGYEDHHFCIISSEAVGAVIELSNKYVTEGKLPDKAIELMDAAGAVMKEISPSNHVYGEEPNIPLMTAEIVAKALSKKTGLPLDKVTKTDRDRILSLKDHLNNAVFGQDEAAAALASAYRISRANLGEVDKPIGNFLFRGPTGVGKTEMTKQLAEELGIPLVRLDMSECMERHSVSKLIGAPPGYVGYDEGGALTEKVHRNPYCVLLLDEIEKAHPDVFNILLQVMDHGELTDASGKKVNFRNVILCMTSNVGEGGKSINAIGFNSNGSRNTKDGEFEERFSPEFRNRLDAVIRFNALTEKTIPRILDKVIGELQERLKKRNTTLSVTAEARGFLAERGFDPEMGARPLKRVFKQHVTDPVATKLLEEDFEGKGGSIIVSERDGHLSVSFSTEISNDNGRLPILVETAAEGPVFVSRRPH